MKIKKCIILSLFLRLAKVLIAISAMVYLAFKGKYVPGELVK
jgi:hypothetical protein